MPRFTQAELESYRDAVVPDLVGPDPRLMFVGINPGLWTAATQTHFAHPVNRFYPALLRAGIIEHPVDAAAGMTDDDRDRLPRPRHRHHQPGPPGHRPGLRADRRGAAGGRPSAAGARARACTRRVVAVAGITAYRSAFGRRKAVLGRQPEPFEGAELWVVPNPSGLNAHETVASLAEAYAAPARVRGTRARL